MDDTFRRTVPRRSALGGAIGVLVLWVLGGVTVANVRPDLWLVPVAAAPVVLLAAGVAAVTRTTVTASRDGVSIRSEPFPMFGDRWIPREDIAVVSIDAYTEDNDERYRWFARAPSVWWAVVVVHPGHGTTWIAKGYPTGDEARAVAEGIRAAVGL